jgi:hypothetical protein
MDFFGVALGANRLKTLLFAVLVASMAGIATTDAQAAHCKALSKAFGDMKKISAQVDRAEARDDMDKACKLQGQYVALARKTLRNTKTECFHGGKQAFEMATGAAEALEEMYCTWEEEDFDENDF